MDKMLYIAASGASQDLLATSIRANNLANANTTGFKAQMAQARSMAAFGEGLPTRVFSIAESPGNVYAPGSMIQTGRDLDLAIQGDGWFAVQDRNGQEAYTRAASLTISTDGILQDAHGSAVVGEAGPIALPIPLSSISVSTDGFISIRPQGAPISEQEEVGRLKFVNPNVADLVRGEDGLFRQKSGEAAALDPTVAVRTGVLEASNVNPLGELMGLIGAQRHYDTQLNIMETADDLDQRGNQLLRII
jgi:flagellar basal-body rod protein FlgF